MNNSSLFLRRQASSLDCFVILDKPQGLSSNQALGKLKRLLNQKKAGHAGTLDPMATGMLPIAFGRATKLLEYCLDHDKRYIATIKLGQQTDTGDKEGNIICEKPVPECNQFQLEQVLAQFVGEIKQIPPMYSALKHNGKRLYQLARQGETVERKVRKIMVQNLTGKLTLTPGPSPRMGRGEICIDVTCSKGTYIRVLGEDIAEALGTVGHLISLDRVETAGFAEAHMLTLEQIEQKINQAEGSFAVPMENVLTDWPKIEINQSDWLKLCQGKSIDLNGNSDIGFVRLFCDGLLVAVAEFEQGQLLRRKIIRPIDL